MKIGVDFGHTLSGADYGASGLKEESILTREVGKLVIQKLIALGHEVINCTCDYANSINSSLAYRVNKANSNKVDIFICIHFNSTPGGTGTEIYTYKGKYLEEADRILKEFEALGLNNRGIKSESLYVLNNTNMKAMLIECAFVDSSHDMQIYNADTFSSAIVKGLTGQSVTPKPVQPAAQPTNTLPDRYNRNVKLFQQAANAMGIKDEYGNRLDEDGVLGKNTLFAVNSQKAVLSKGMSNALVAAMQFMFGLAVTSTFDTNAYNVVGKFQESKNLDADHIVGFKTWIELFKAWC